MNISEFLELSFGQWRSQRSGNHLAFTDLEKALPTTDIISLTTDNPTVLEIRNFDNIENAVITQPFRMAWQGKSMPCVPISNPAQPYCQKLPMPKGMDIETHA